MAGPDRPEQRDRRAAQEERDRSAAGPPGLRRFQSERTGVRRRRRVAVPSDEEQAAQRGHRSRGAESAARLSRADPASPFRRAVIRRNRYHEEASAGHGEEQTVSGAQSAEGS